MSNFRGGRFAAGMYGAVIAAFALIVTAVTPASAEGLFAPLSAGEARLATAQAAPQHRLFKRSRITKLDAGALARHIAPLGIDTAGDRIARANTLDGVITLALFSDAAATFRRTNVDAVGENGFAWSGEVNNNPAEFASLIIENGEVTGHVQLDRRFFHIHPVGNGLHRVTELDPSKFPPDHPPGYKQPHSSLPLSPLVANEAAAAPAPTIIRVLIAYTAEAAKQAKAYYGGVGENAIKAQAKQAIALANAAYATGKIPLKLVLAGTLSTGTFKDMDNFDTLLESLDGRRGAALAAVRTKRTQLKADLVVLLKRAAYSCGKGNFTELPGPGNESRAYSVVDFTCISTYSVHHEIGHNMGLRHDRYVDGTQGIGYNFGYANKLGGCKIRDVMAYDWICPSGCPRVNMFSTGRIKVKVRKAMCAIGIKKGSPNAADGERRLIETKKAVSVYKK